MLLLNNLKCHKRSVYLASGGIVGAALRHMKTVKSSQKIKNFILFDEALKLTTKMLEKLSFVN